MKIVTRYRNVGKDMDDQSITTKKSKKWWESEYLILWDSNTTVKNFSLMNDIIAYVEIKAPEAPIGGSKVVVYISEFISSRMIRGDRVESGHKSKRYGDENLAYQIQTRKIHDKAIRKLFNKSNKRILEIYGTQVRKLEWI